MSVSVDTCTTVVNHAEVTDADWLKYDPTSNDNEDSVSVRIMLTSTREAPTSGAIGGAMLMAMPQGGAEPAEAGTTGHDAGELSGPGQPAKSAPDAGTAFTVVGVAPPWGPDASSGSAGVPEATPVTPAGGGETQVEESGDVQPPTQDDRPAVSNGVSVWERTATKGARRWQPVIAFDAMNDDVLAMGVFGPYVGS
jgi:hypothetical protein